MKATETIKKIILNGTPAEKKQLFSFNKDTSEEKILKKFKLFIRSNYPRYFEQKETEEHNEAILNHIKSYKGIGNFIELAFRGFAKTTYSKLFIAYVLLNDEDEQRKYIKVLSKDYSNSRQIVTDIYNLMVEVMDIYGDVFEQSGKIKREETMSSFTMSNGRKLTAGTVGQTQRGHIQDAYRPDWILFEDIEDSESISSIAITEKIIRRCDEAISGLSVDGNYVVNGNYISDAGVIQWFINKPSTEVHIVPIALNVKTEGKKLLEAEPIWGERYNFNKIQEILEETNDFAGEYLCDPTLSGDTFFNREIVDADLKNAKEPNTVSAGVRYWGIYQPHHNYGTGLDLSDGVGLDSCAMSLIDFTKGELVVTADDNETSPDLFTYQSIKVCREFGNTKIAPEINNTCGGIALRVLQEENYPNIYRRKVKDRIDKTETKKLGWKTDKRTKHDMFYDFKKDYEDGLIDIYDERVLKEMKAFTKQDLNENRKGVVTRHFDLLTSVVIAWQLKEDVKMRGTDLSQFSSKSRFK